MAGNFFARRVVEDRMYVTKCMQQLMGICTGLIADNQLNDIEIRYLRTWIKQHEEIADQWPMSNVRFKVNEVLADGVITEPERVHLVDILKKMTRVDFLETGDTTADGPMLPVDDDAPVEFQDMLYCFTGDFIFGTRAACERAVLARGAMAVSRVSMKLDYLVIGNMVTKSWRNTTYGTKIETALKYRERGRPVRIVSEDHWAAAIKACAGP
jgi:NAD-dependent DNA ligase